MNKAKAQFIHAKRRAKERYKLILSKKEYDDLVNLVQENKSESLYKESNRISIKKILYEDQELYFAYDNKRHTIVTFLHEEYVDWEFVEKLKQDKIENKEFRSLTDWELVKNFIKKI